MIAKGQPFAAVPVMMDDYKTLGYCLANFGWSAVRPMTYFVMSLLSICGIKIFFLAMSLMTIAYIALVFSFLIYFFEIKRTPVILVLFAAVCLVSWEYFCWYYLFTGIVANMLSGLFGVSAMYCFLQSFREENGQTKKFIGGLLLTLLSLLTKEDFFLPILLLCLYFVWAKNQFIQKKAGLALLLVAGLGALIFLEQRLSAGSIFLSSGAGPYHLVIGWPSIISTTWTYLGGTAGTLIALIVQLITFSLALYLSQRSDWSRLIFLQIIIASLIFPFTLLPNHIYPYYALNWLAWQCGSCLILGNVLTKLRDKQRHMSVQIVLSIWLLLLMPLVVWLTDKERSSQIEAYAQWIKLNKQILKTLKTNRDWLAKYQTIAVIGAPVTSPWVDNNAFFLERYYDLHCQWLVLVPKDSNFYYFFGNQNHGRVKVRDLAELSKYSQLPSLRLLPDGEGKVFAGKNLSD